MTAGRVSAYILLGLNGLEFANSIRSLLQRRNWRVATLTWSNLPGAGHK